MIAYPTWLKPEILTVGPLTLRWYGFMYVVGYVIGTWILRDRARKGLFKVNYAQADGFVTYLFIGMIVGARIVYALVYNWDEYSANPLEIFYVWKGGLSFHGALIGMTTAAGLYARKIGQSFYMVADTLCFSAPPGLFFGRLGNFINGELWGRQTDVPWAMVFPRDPEKLPRHPSQLYESLCEGLLMFLILSFLQQRTLKKGSYRYGYISAAFLIGYGVLRFGLEFFREPDVQLGLVLGPFSMGQLLCFLMILAGIFVLWHSGLSEKPLKPVPPSPEYLNSPD